MSAHVRTRGNDPSGYVLSGPEAHEARALSTREEAEPFLAEIEQVSYALGLFWDHGPLDVGEASDAAPSKLDVLESVAEQVDAGDGWPGPETK